MVLPSIPTSKRWTNSNASPSRLTAPFLRLGMLEFHFLEGSRADPTRLAKQYAEIVGQPAEVLYWSSLSRAPKLRLSPTRSWRRRQLLLQYPVRKPSRGGRALCSPCSRIALEYSRSSTGSSPATLRGTSTRSRPPPDT
ncbi:hypothetical protein C8J57DRAFT_1708874 [Mycena rebaudengoi]|nr:hypothetical protein C8J57DRAFT_1708874 [Mycena rebaudengoi]